MTQGQAARGAFVAVLDALVLVMLWAPVSGLPGELAVPHRWVK